jgi:hypothetical protein
MGRNLIILHKDRLMKLILILGYWICIVYGGALVLKSAQEQVQTINTLNTEKCEIINASLPGACKMN